jgi:hypothetical protein
MSRIAHLLFCTSGTLSLAAVVAAFGLIEPAGPEGRDDAIRKMGMGAANRQPSKDRFGGPTRDYVREAEARVRELQTRAGREDQLLNQFGQMRRENLQFRAGLAGQRVFVQSQWADGQVEQSVFQQYSNASGARRQLDWQLAMQIVEIERTCKLSDVQKRKLQLAGRGDIKRFFDRYEEVKRKAEATEQDEQMVEEIPQDINALQMTLQAGLFHDESLLVMSLSNTLTGEQFARYDAKARAHRSSHHREIIGKAAAVIQRWVFVSDARQRELITLLSNETKPSPRQNPYEAQVLLLQLVRLPQEKLRGVFAENQLEIVTQRLAGYQQLEPMLKKAGLMPVDDDRADSRDVQPAPAKQ